MTINYTSNNVQKTFEVEMPDTLYVRLDKISNAILNCKSENNYNGQSTGLYNYTSIDTESNKLVGFLLAYKYNLVEKTPELDETYDDIITYNKVIVTETDGEYIFDTQYFETLAPAGEAAEDYVPPTVPVEVRPENAPIIPAVEPVPNPALAE